MSIEIPGYNIDKQIGSGGMATVYLALQENLHRKVALKVMTPGLAVDETYCHRFLKEGRIAAQLNHLNLLTVYDIGVHENHYYMASEYLPGGTVRDRMKPAVPENDAVTYISDIAQGLQYAHSHGFVHRDVKPGNMLFRANGDCVLGDFGIAKAVDSNTGATKLGTSIGTPHYMSPEQAKGEKVDHRTDLYSLGVVFYEILNGKLPYDADDPFSVALMQINEPVPTMPSHMAKFQPLIDKLMAKDRDKRYSCADDFLDDLESITGMVSGGRKTTKRRVDEPGAVAEPSTPAPPKSSPAPSGPSEARTTPDYRRSASGSSAGGGRSKWLMISVIGTLLIAAGGTTWYFMKDSGDSGTDSGTTGTTTSTTTTSGNNTASDNTTTDTGNNNAADQRKEQIANLLEQADNYIEHGQYLSPVNQNAFDTYQRVLSLDADNDKATLGLRTLAKTVESSANEALSRGDTAAARLLVEQASRAFPNDLGIRYLRETLSDGTDTVVTNDTSQGTDTGSTTGSSDLTQADASEVESLITRADNYFDQNIMSFPPGKNAMDLYLEVIDLDPDNVRANEQLEYIANMWALTAEGKIKEGEMTMARRMIDRGLKARPNHPRLLELQGDIN